MKRKKPFQLTIEPDPCPKLVVELGPKNEGVGNWVTTDKHTRLAKYIVASSRARKKFLNHRLYIDPFCGPGRIRVKGESDTRDGGAVVAWKQSLASGAPFSQMFIGDADEERLRACEQRLLAINAPVKAFVGPAVNTVKLMMEQMPTESSLSLAYIDPYNLEYLSFSIVADLSKLKKIDFAVNFCTMDLKRNIDMELDPNRARFDEVAPGWRERFAAINHSKSQLQEEFFSYWVSLVKGCDFRFSNAMPWVLNDRGHAIYRLIFFSRSDFPNGLWDDIAKSPNREFNF